MNFVKLSIIFCPRLRIKSCYSSSYTSSKISGKGPDSWTSPSTSARKKLEKEKYWKSLLGTILLQMSEVVTKWGCLFQNSEFAQRINQEQSLLGFPSKYLSKNFRKMTVISVMFSLSKKQHRLLPKSSFWSVRFSKARKTNFKIFWKTYFQKYFQNLLLCGLAGCSYNSFGEKLLLKPSITIVGVT